MSSIYDALTRPYQSTTITVPPQYPHDMGKSAIQSAVGTFLNHAIVQQGPIKTTAIAATSSALVVLAESATRPLVNSLFGEYPIVRGIVQLVVLGGTDKICRRISADCFGVRLDSNSVALAANVFCGLFVPSRSFKWVM